jgi:hypothetical protein
MSTAACQRSHNTAMLAVWARKRLATLAQDAPPVVWIPLAALEELLLLCGLTRRDVPDCFSEYTMTNTEISRWTRETPLTAWTTRSRAGR